MSAVDQVFEQLRAAGRKAFIPFVTAGDPDLELTARLIARLDRAGASLCEIGLPYSDPIADGPVIQASYTRALARGLRVADVFAMTGQLAPQLKTPLLTMASYAIIYRRGLERYVDEAQQAGIAGAIVPDLLIEESEDLAAICRQRDFSLVQLVTPTTPPERARRIAEASTGFLYYVSITGITGERQELPQKLIDDVGALRERASVPICVGFGISRPEHVRRLAPVADGVIVGSAIMRRIADAAGQPPEAILDDVDRYVGELLAECGG